MSSLSFVLVQPGKRSTAASKHEQRVGIHSHAQKVTQQRKREKRRQDQEKEVKGTPAVAGRPLDNHELAKRMTDNRNVWSLIETMRYKPKYSYGLPTPSPEPDIQIARSLTHYSSWTDDHKYGVSMFTHVTVLDINESATNMTFWTQDVPALSEVWTCIRDIVSAIAAANQAIQDRDSKLILTALELHLKALAALRRDVAMLPLSAQVACCLLFDAFNLLRCDFVQAGGQIAIAKKLTSKLQLDAYLEDEKLPTVCDALTRMDQTAAWSLWNPSNFLRYEGLRHAEPTLHLDLLPVDTSASILQGLVESMGRLSRHFSGRMRRNLSDAAFVNPTSRLAQDVLQEFRLWKGQFDEYVLKYAQVDERATIEQAEIAWNFTYVTFCTGVLGCGELVYDDSQYLPRYDRINDLAEQRFVESAEFSRHTNIKAFLQIIVPSLWLVVLMCRDPQIRARSVAILKSRQYQEGEFNSVIAGRMAEAVIELEVFGLDVHTASDVPLQNRICIEGIKYLADTEEVALRYSLASQRHVSAPEYQKRIHWKLEGDPVNFNNAIGALSQTCTLYRKALPSAAFTGYIKPMCYKGELVPICFGVPHGQGKRSLQVNLQVH